MGLRKWLSPLATASLLFLSSAARSDEWPACQSNTPDVSIAGCTKIIKAGKQSARNIAGAHFFRGNSYLAKDDFKSAIADYNKAIALNPKDGDFYINRGAAYEQIKEFDLALQDESKAIELKPGAPGPYANRGNAYVYKGDRARAIEDYSKAISLSPDVATYYVSRGYAYSLVEQNEKALLDYRKALELDPANKEAKSYLIILGG